MGEYVFIAKDTEQVIHDMRMEAKSENVLYNIRKRENIKHRFWEKGIELYFLR